MATVIGAPSGDGVMASGDDQVVTTAGPTQKQQQVYAVLVSPFFHVFVLALILCQILMTAIDASNMAIGKPLPWSGPVMFIIALLFLPELGARIFLAGSCRCARTFYGKLDAVSVILFSLGAVMSFVNNLPFVTVFTSCARICRVDLITRSATWFLPRWTREVVCLLLVFPLSHVVWSILAIQMLHPVHKKLHERGDSDYAPEAFANVGSAMIHMLPHNWGLFGTIISNHPWTVIFIGANISNWVFFFARAAVFSVRACRTTRSQEQDRALAEALWTCELQFSEVHAGGQNLQDGWTGAERSQAVGEDDGLMMWTAVDGVLMHA